MTNSQSPAKTEIDELTNLELAQILARKVAISNYDWHKLKNNRQAQAVQQITASLVYLLNGDSQEALQHLNQAQGWLDRTIKPMACPDHGHSQKKNND